MPDPLLLFGALFFTAGYLLGRARPIRSVREWAWWSICSYGDAHQSSPRMVAALALWPEIAWKAWRRRNDPPPARSPAPKLNEKWQAKLGEDREP